MSNYSAALGLTDFDFSGVDTGKLAKWQREFVWRWLQRLKIASKEDRQRILDEVDKERNEQIAILATLHPASKLGTESYIKVLSSDLFSPKPIENDADNPPLECNPVDVLRAAGLSKRRAHYLDELEAKGDIIILERPKAHKQPYLIQFADPKRREQVEQSRRDYRRDGVKPVRKNGRMPAGL